VLLPKATVYQNKPFLFQSSLFQVFAGKLTNTTVEWVKGLFICACWCAIIPSPLFFCKPLVL
jgi:hypothetical protein